MFIRNGRREIRNFNKISTDTNRVFKNETILQMKEKQKTIETQHPLLRTTAPKQTLITPILHETFSKIETVKNEASSNLELNQTELKIEIDTAYNKKIQNDLEIILKRMLQLEERVQKIVEKQENFETTMKADNAIFEQGLLNITQNLEQGVKNTLGKLKHDVYKEINQISHQAKRTAVLNRNAHDIEKNLSQNLEQDQSNNSALPNEMRNNSDLQNILSRIQVNLGRLSS